MEAVPLVVDVHHIHNWSLASDPPVATLHAVLAEGADHDEALASIHRALEELFGLSHATVQLERSGCGEAYG